MITMGITTTNVTGLLAATNAKIPTTTNKVCEKKKHIFDILLLVTKYFYDSGYTLNMIS